MEQRPFSLAIETSSRQGSISLGRGAELLESVDLPEQRRHAVELMPAVERLCRRHGASPARLGCIHVSVGPGSFTGLRVGVTTAKMLAWAAGASLVAVPTLRVVVENTPPGAAHAAVLLNTRQGRCYTGIFTRSGRVWEPTMEPALLDREQMLQRAPRPLLLLADASVGSDWPEGVERLDPALAIPRSDVVWRIGRAEAEAGRFADPMALTPLYVRRPEAEEVWEARHPEP